MHTEKHIILGAPAAQKLPTLSAVARSERLLCFIVATTITITVIIIATYITSLLHRQLLRDLLRIQEVLHEEVRRQRLETIIRHRYSSTTDRTGNFGTRLAIFKRLA